MLDGVCVVTGASRGIGREIALQMARAATSLKMLLLARSADELRETQRLIGAVNPRVVVVCATVDLSQAVDFDQVLRSIPQEPYERAVIFHNAGHLGDIKPAYQIRDDAWPPYFRTNVFSAISLNNSFISTFGGAKQLVIVNVTSLCGREPFKYLSMYGSAKAARDLYFKVLAAENPGYKVLNYSPGMVNTAMANELLANSFFKKDLGSEPVKLNAEQTVEKLVDILLNEKYKSGDTIDYYDTD